MMTSNGNNPPPIRKGDIRRIEPLVGLNAQPRLALIVHTPNSCHDSAEIMLSHERVEMATLDDAVVYPDPVRFPNGLVVQTRLRGVLWKVQVSDFVTSLTPSDMDTIANSASPHANPVDNHSAHATDAKLNDEMRDFQESELRAMWDLTGDYTDTVLDDDTPWRIDTDLLSPHLLTQYDEPRVMLMEALHILRTREVVVTLEDLLALKQSGAFQMSNWRAPAYDAKLAFDVVDSIASLHERSSRYASSVQHTPGHENLSQAVQVNIPNRISEARQLSLPWGTRLVTAPFLWQDAGHELMRQAEYNDHHYHNSNNSIHSDNASNGIDSDHNSDRNSNNDSMNQTDYPIFEIMMLATPTQSVGGYNSTSSSDSVGRGNSVGSGNLAGVDKDATHDD